jgi:MFS family permease
VNIIRKFLIKLKEEFYFVRGTFLFILIVSLLNGFLIGLYGPFRSQYIIALGATPFLLGLMGSLTSLITVIIQIPGGYMADRYGRKIILTIFTFSAALGFLIYAIAPDWRYIAVAIIVVNLSRIYRPAQAALQADSMPREKRGMGYSLLRTAPALTGSFSPFIGGYIVERFGLIPGVRLEYLAVFVGLVLMGVFGWLIVEEPIESKQELTYRNFSSSFIESYMSLRETFNLIDERLRVLVLLLILYSSTSPIYTFTALYVTNEIGISFIQWGFITTVFTFVSLLLSLPAGKIVDKIGRKRSILFGFLLNAPGYLFFPFVDGFFQVLIIEIIWSISGAFVYPSIMSLQADFTTKEIRGRVMGMITVLRNLVIIPSSAFYGYIYGVLPKFSFFTVFGFQIIIIGIIVLILQEPEREEQQNAL